MSKVIVHVKLGIKPFSANGMHFMSKKRDTPKYKAFRGDINEVLGNTNYKVDPKAHLKLTLVAGFSNKAADLDNSFKPLLDAMQTSMGFDDKQVYEIEAYKDVVKRGEEYLMIKLEQKPASVFKKAINRLLEVFK